MTKYIISLLGIYLIYYIILIIYDLFLKKENKKDAEEEVEEFAMEGMEEDSEDEIQEVGIDDVEELTIPSSSDEYELEKNEGGIVVSEEELKEKYEEEKRLEEIQEKEEKERKKKERNREIEYLIEQTKIKAIKEVTIESREEDKAKEKFEAKYKREIKFKEMLNQATSNVYILNQIEGEKIYGSIMHPVN